MNRTFKEVPTFTTKWQSLGLTDEDLRILENILLRDPKTGDAIPGTGGVNMSFYEDIERSLLEAIEMEKGSIPLEQRENMPAPTFIAANREKELIDELINLRKEQNMSQSQLAKLTGNKQQAISRIEKKEHSPSLKLFFSMINALGYDLKIVKSI